MKRNPYARYTEAMCAHCTAPFEARLSELARGAGRFCSPACKYAAARGRTYVTVTCSNEACRKVFTREAFAVRQVRRPFCSKACSDVAYDPVERRENGRRGGSAPHRAPSPEVAVARSRLGGLARARSQPRERLQEIGRMGVAARMAKPDTVRRRWARKAAISAGKTVRWFGVPITPGAASPARGCEGSADRPANPVGAHQREEEVDA